MKKLMLALLGIMFAYSSASALSFEESRNRAWYLTDKMAYELNLTPEQYDKAYEINLNYFLNINYASDIDGQYWRYRNQDLSYILFDWQFNRYVDISYFYRPLIWRSGVCIMTTYDFYDRGFFYFSRPAIYSVYRGISWRERPRHNPYQRMTFSANGGMRERYGEWGHGYYYRNGERFDAPKYNGEHYGRRNDRRNPGPDFDKGMTYDHRNEGHNNGRDFGRNDKNPQAGNSNRNNGKVYGSGNNYRDKNENSGNAGYKFENDNRNNGNNPQQNRIQTPDNNNGNNSNSGMKYVSTDNNRSNLNSSRNFSIGNRNNSNTGSTSNNVGSANSNRSYTPGGRTGATRTNVSGSGNSSRSFSQRIQSSSNASRSVQSPSPATRNTSSTVQSAPSNRSNTGSTGNNSIRTRSFGKR